MRCRFCRLGTSAQAKHLSSQPPEASDLMDSQRRRLKDSFFFDQYDVPSPSIRLATPKSRTRIDDGRYPWTDAVGRRLREQLGRGRCSQTHYHRPPDFVVPLLHQMIGYLVQLLAKRSEGRLPQAVELQTICYYRLLLVMFRRQLRSRG
jgi:hypothetical protein